MHSSMFCVLRGWRIWNHLGGRLGDGAVGSNGMWAFALAWNACALGLALLLCMVRMVG